MQNIYLRYIKAISLGKFCSQKSLPVLNRAANEVCKP